MTNKTILLAGLYSNKSSIGEIFRRYVDCFKEISNPDIIDLQPIVGSPNLYTDLYKTEDYKSPINQDIRYIHTTINTYIKIKERAKKNQKLDSKKISYFVWESSELNLNQIDCLHDNDEIWTASKYCKDIFAQYIDSDKIKLVTHPIPIPTRQYKKYKKFTVLVIGNISSSVDRKNTVETLKTANKLKENYGKDVDVIFKTFTINDAEKNFLEKKKTLFPKIKIIDDFYDSRKTQQLIGKCHVILSLHKSEGFGLTLAEAMANKTIPIATNHSGNIDFMNEENSFLVDYEVQETNNPHFSGEWAIPNSDDAYQKLEYCYKNYDSLDKMKKSGLDFIKTNHSHKKISKIIEETL